MLVLLCFGLAPASEASVAVLTGCASSVQVSKARAALRRHGFCQPPSVRMGINNQSTE